MKKINKFIRGFILSTILGLLVIGLIMNSEGYDKVKAALMQYPLQFILYAILVAFSRWVFEAFGLIVSLWSRYRISFILSMKTSIITHFFNLLTPFYSGGQPFTIYYLTKEGIGAGESTAAIFMKSLVFQAVLSLLGVAGLIICKDYLNQITFSASILGILINGSLVFIIFLFGLNKTLAKWVVNGSLLLLSKLKLLKSAENTKTKVMEKVKQFHEAFAEYRKNPILIILLFFFSFMQFFLYVLSALIVLKGYGIATSVQMYFQLVNMNVTAAIVPTPGTSGGIEYLFLLFLRDFGPPEKISAGLIIWRFCTYYFEVSVLGFCAFWIYRRMKKRSIGQISLSEKENNQA